MGPIITITTDFGTADGYQAVLEGIIAGINPEARVVNISQEIAPGDIAEGWYMLKTHHYYFPPGTVHLAIVDPGVGSRRKIITVRTRRYQFVAPDNGLLSFIPKKDILSIHSVTNRKYALADISPVFHGRDIMAPAAAYLSRTVDPACLGRSCQKIVDLPGVRPKVTKAGIRGRVLRVDRFGNLITNIDATRVDVSGTVSVNGQDLGSLRLTFSDVRPGKPLAYIGSGSHLEIAVRDGSAFHYFLPAEGDEIQIFVAR
ncbi:MAG: SAM-dependent chlorinase/fluorinase [FCB group bacterium]|nr:SAM-dependent chlorinase/fluorinase [FCB group bacterium]